MNLVVVPLLFFSFVSDFLAQARPNRTDTEEIVTTFRFYGMLICRKKQGKFKFRMVLRELDEGWFSKPDVIDTLGVKDGHGTFNYTLDGIQKGDELGSEDYTVELSVVHNCHNDGLLRKLTRTFTVPIATGKHEVEEKIDLSVEDENQTTYAVSYVDKFFDT